MLSSLHHKLTFDEFTLDTVRATLLRGDTELSLRRQSFEVLRYLAQHAGTVVSSDDLIEALWSMKPADPTASVGQCIKEIRRAMGDDARWSSKPSLAAATSSWPRSCLAPLPCGRTRLFQHPRWRPPCRTITPQRVKQSRHLRRQPGVDSGRRQACLPSPFPACSSPVSGCSGRGVMQHPVKAQ